MTTSRRRSRLALALLPLGAVACQSGGAVEGGAPVASAADARSGFTITERAELGPITALAARGSVLYAGTARGLRRWDLASDEYEVLGPETGLLGHGVTALGLDGDGQAWVATEAGIGRFTHTKVAAGDGAAETYQPMGGLAGVTALAPLADGRGAWAGGAEGLFRSDGTSWTPIGDLRGAAVTSLDLDRDGRSAWVGTRALGLFLVDGDRARDIPLGDDVAALEIVGTAVTAVGTRVVAARGAGPGVGGARLIFLEEGDAQAFRAQPDVPIVRVVDTGKDAVLVAGAAGAERAYALRLVHAGEQPPPGGLRFLSVRKGTASSHARDRWAAVPLDEQPPPGVTVIAGGDGAVFYGTLQRGVARGAKPRPAYLSGAGLVGDAERVHVACVARARCFVVTEGPRAWVTDGDTYRETRVGEADDGAALAVVADAAGTVYALSTEPSFTGLVVTRLVQPPSGGAEGADTWRTFERVPLKMPSAGPPGVSFAAISPQGALWVGVRAHVEGGDDVSAGAVEIELASQHVVQHPARGAGERPTPEMLPLPAALTGVLFDDVTIWFSSLSGVSRWQQGELRTWGENDGLQSELVHAVAKAPGGAVWAATSEGLARLDGKVWRSLGGGEEGVVACRGLARDATGAMWVATAKGLRRVTADDAKAGRLGDLVLAGDMRDVRVDREGRAWALSSSSIALVSR